MRKFTYTYFPSLYQIDVLQHRSESWHEVVESFLKFAQAPTKLTAPGFGPYLLADPAVPCWEHKGLEHRTAHRCDHCVSEASMLVFDVDRGTHEQVSSLMERLVGYAIRFLAYTTWSHGTKDPLACWRLVVPLNASIAPSDYDSVRRHFIQAYSVPADPNQCSGRSHFYFWPCLKDGAPPTFTHHNSGMNFHPTPEFFKHHNQQKYPPTAVSHAWVPDGSGDPDKAHVLQIRDSLGRALADARVGEGHIRKLALGQSLAEHGHRNSSMLRAAGYLTWKYPGYSVGTYCEVLRPSLEAMIAEGSHLTEDIVERMVMSGMRKRWAKDQWQNAQIEKSIQALDAWVTDTKRAADEAQESR